ncbi:MAG TPA: hypothetical protein VF668_01380 [Pyrinomonadaceae bacterium]|jgi:hypothetical protein
MRDGRTKSLTPEENATLKDALRAGTEFLLSPEERRALALAVLASRGLPPLGDHYTDAPDVAAEIGRVWKWAEGVKLDSGLLRNVFTGGMVISFAEGAREPDFSLTEAGIRYVEDELLPEAVRGRVKGGGR